MGCGWLASVLCITAPGFSVGIGYTPATTACVKQTPVVLRDDFGRRNLPARDDVPSNFRYKPLSKAMNVLEGGRNAFDYLDVPRSRFLLRRGLPAG